MEIVVGALVMAGLVALRVYELKHSPHCQWCNSRHRGRCIWNPRAGKIFANVNDGHFDYDDPNQ